MYVCWWGCVAYVVGGWCNNVTSSGSDASIRTRTCERSGWSPSYISYVRACSRTGKSAMTCRFEIDSLRRAPYVWFAKFYSCSGGNCFSTNARDIFEWWINKLTLAFNLIRLRLLPVDLECNNTACMATAHRPRPESSWVLTARLTRMYVPAPSCFPQLG